MITLSEGLEIVIKLKARGKYKPHWYTRPIELLIEQMGNVPVTAVTDRNIFNWYQYIHTLKSERFNKPLSPYTINSYTRALKAYFSHLEKIGHIAKSPARSLRLPKLGTTSKNAIKDDDLDRMVNFSARWARDHAIILVLRDSGCRIGELASMEADKVWFEQYYTEGQKVIVVSDKNPAPPCMVVHWRGSALIYSAKGNEFRKIFFGHETSMALQRYLATRLPDSPTAVWLQEWNDEPLTSAGISQRLKSIGERVGAKTWNAHSFRHRLAKKLKEKRVDPEIISRLLGHKDVTTYLSIYGTTRDNELQDYFTVYSKM